MLKNILLYMFLFLGVILSSCEDDPLLGPQISECAPGDSYCEISLPGGDKEDSKDNNPEIF